MGYCEIHQKETGKRGCGYCAAAKRKATMIKRYGVANALQSPEFRKKHAETCLKLYGNAVPMRNEAVREKLKVSVKKKYGVEHTLQVKEIRDKGAATMLALYGSTSAISNPEIKAKRVQTCLERFGCENQLQNAEVLAKRKETNLGRYGSDEVLKLESIKEKVRDTMTALYGAPNPLQSQEIKDRKDATCVERYGTSNLMEVAEIFDKKQKSGYLRKEFTLPSGTVITYQGYEDVAIRQLLSEMGEEVFTNDVKVMPRMIYFHGGKRHRYYPDLYIPSQKRFIEVKSTWTYSRYLPQNEAKAQGCLQDGYAFEFWICSAKGILEIVRPVLKAVVAASEEDAVEDVEDAEETDEINN